LATDGRYAGNAGAISGGVREPHDILKMKSFWLDRHAGNAGAISGWLPVDCAAQNPSRITVRVGDFSQAQGCCNGRMASGDQTVARSIGTPDPNRPSNDKETVMNYAATAALALALSLAAGSTFAADAPAKAVTPQQQRMKDCNTQATGKHGDERKAFMSTCLKGNSSAAAATPKHATSKSKSDASAGKH
jgi:hypothetical protein